MGNNLPTLTDCGPPPMISHGNATKEPLGVPTYACHDGYDLHGEASNLICVFGSWVGDLPNCSLPEVGSALTDVFSDPTEDFPLWLTITLPPALLLATGILTCCLVILCCLGKKRDQSEDEESGQNTSPKNCELFCFKSVKKTPVISIKPQGT